MPRDDSGELDTAVAFLRFARESVLKKTEGLDDEQVRRVIVPTGTNLLGLVQHLTVAERYWFGHHVAGIGKDDSFDFTMEVPAGASTEQILDDYRASIEESDTIIQSAGDPEAKVIQPVDGTFHTLRWVLAHMTSETVRHAGHADILREQIDGTTGR